MKLFYDDGGRAKAGYKGEARDCAVRALAIAASIPYQEAYEKINELAKSERTGKRKKSVSGARTGVYRQTMNKAMEYYGFKWRAVVRPGTGCTMHLRHEEIPGGVIVARVSKHYVAIKDRVVHDTHDPCRGGDRMVYGYWYKPE